MDKNKRSDFWIFTTQALLGIVYIGLGIFMITRTNFVWSALFFGLRLLLLSSSVLFMYRFIRYRTLGEFARFVGAIVASLVFYFNEILYVDLLAAVFGIWAIFNALVHGLEVYVAIVEKQRIKPFNVLLFFIDFGFGLLLLVNGFQNRKLINYQVGFYLIVFGSVQIFSACMFIFQGNSTIRMSAPVLVSGLLPPFVVDRVPRLKVDSPELFKDDIESTVGNFVSVYVHIRNEGYNRLGHVDIGYNGAIYSYGAFDPFKRAVSSIYGAGVMIVGVEKDFVQFTMESDVSVYRYKIRLNDNQVTHIEKSIDKLFEDAYVYDFPLVDDKYYLSRLKTFSPPTTYYKFESEPLKTYNLFTTNCVLIADRILQSTGMKLFQMSGVITPGAYYAYLENLKSSPDSIVVDYATYSTKV